MRIPHAGNFLSQPPAHLLLPPACEASGTDCSQHPSQNVTLPCLTSRRAPPLPCPTSRRAPSLPFQLQSVPFVSPPAPVRRLRVPVRSSLFPSFPRPLPSGSSVSLPAPARCLRFPARSRPISPLPCPLQSDPFSCPSAPVEPVGFPAGTRQASTRLPRCARSMLHSQSRRRDPRRRSGISPQKIQSASSEVGSIHRV